MASAPLIHSAEPIANVETEAALISALLLDNNQIDRVSDIVTGEDFSDPFYGQVYGICVDERARGNAVHVLSLRRALGEEKTRLLIDLGTNAATLVGAQDFAREIHELGRKRRIVDGLETLLAEAKQIGLGTEKSADELTADAETILSESADRYEARKHLSAAECIGKVMDGLNDRDTGVHSGIGSLDATLGGIRAGNLVIMGGRPGMGKSAVASSYAIGASMRNHGTLFVSLEMSAEELGERMAADLCFDSETQIPYGAITNANVTVDQGREMARAAERIRDLPLTIIDTGTATLGKLNALVRRHKRRFAAKNRKLELVIVDYLQLVSPDHREKDLYTRVTEVSKGLKALAKTHQVGVLALCQLSRKVEERTEKRPQMADLRDSGQIEQDADAIVFLFSEEYYLLQCEPVEDADKHAIWETKLDELRNKIEFIVAKRRRGPAGVGYGRFYRSFQAVRG